MQVQPDDKKDILIDQILALLRDASDTQLDLVYRFASALIK